MDFDPLARDLPPPRYQVESGSEDESNDRTAKLPVGDVLLDLDRDVTESRDVVVLVAGAGRAWLERDAAQVPPEDGTVQFEREQQASIHIPQAKDDPVVVFVMPSSKLPQSHLHDVASKVLEALKPKSLRIIDSYSPLAFGYHIDRSQEDAHPVRYLSSGEADKTLISKSWQKLRAPDFIAGTTAAFAARAVVQGIPVIAIQVPDQSPQSHAQLYGSGQGKRSSAPARLDEEAYQAIGSLIPKVAARASPVESGSTSLLDFVRNRRPEVPRNILGDGGMYM